MTYLVPFEYRNKRYVLSGHFPWVELGPSGFPVRWFYDDLKLQKSISESFFRSYISSGLLSKNRLLDLGGAFKNYGSHFQESYYFDFALRIYKRYVKTFDSEETGYSECFGSISRCYREMKKPNGSIHLFRKLLKKYSYKSKIFNLYTFCSVGAAYFDIGEHGIGIKFACASYRLLRDKEFFDDKRRNKAWEVFNSFAASIEEKNRACRY